MPRPCQDELERFAALCEVDPATGCILWTGALSRHSQDETAGGYGIFRVKAEDGKWMNVYAHRWSLAYWLGRPIKAGHESDHKCNTRNCVNPFHLQEVTARQNKMLMALRRKVKGIVAPVAPVEESTAPWEETAEAITALVKAFTGEYYAEPETQWYLRQVPAFALISDITATGLECPFTEPEVSRWLNALTPTTVAA